MKNVFGICNLHDGPYLGELTQNRPLAANTFLGRYALMDFALSNFTNSGINRMGILVEKQLASIHDHTRDGHVWIRNTKTGGLHFFTNENMFNSERFNTDIANILANKNFFIFNNADYYVITNPFFLMSIDFESMVKAHVESGKDITIAYKHAKDANINYKNCDSLTIKNGVVTRILRNSGTRKEADISLETIVVSKYILMNLCEASKEVSALYTIRKMIKYACDNQLMSINPYEFDGYVVPVLTLQDYVRHSMELLDYENRKQLFHDDWPIYTTIHNTPPAIYGENAVVENCFIANGAMIKGKVINSIISRDVIIEEGAVVKNSILFTRTRVGSGVKINHVLSDKQAKILNTKEISGEPDKVLVIKKGVLV